MKMRKNFSPGSVKTMGGLDAGTFPKGRHGMISNNSPAPRVRPPRRKKKALTQNLLNGFLVLN